MNSDAKVMQSVGFYYLEAHYGEPGDYAGPDLLAEWHRRNMHIFNNVTKLVTSPDDRILVIFGAGHLGWLRQDFGADPTLRLRKLEEFAAHFPSLSPTIRYTSPPAPDLNASASMTASLLLLPGTMRRCA